MLKRRKDLFMLDGSQREPFMLLNFMCACILAHVLLVACLMRMCVFMCVCVCFHINAVEVPRKVDQFCCVCACVCV